MKVLAHHIYEYKKGLRSLVLHTLDASSEAEAVRRLERNNISYLIRRVNKRKINIFFGNKACVHVVTSFGDKPLNAFTPEEDFILGIMLGYNRTEQCKRYLARKEIFGIEAETARDLSFLPSGSLEKTG
ncbi:DUF2023 family protein [Sediminispirochaeta bajacaliforniensis]|uniref:DUF2023 family protein n=1 Tax=Sediminispirochaeta bajacaliforniensis TaxID=148 RepID=UPI00037F446A|nr:DUF2023 family protein [Sediminispirochaeta bajacaliforniensis]